MKVITLVCAVSLGRMHQNIDASLCFRLIFPLFLLKTQGADCCRCDTWWIAITNTIEAINIYIYVLKKRQMLWCFYGPSETRLPVTDKGNTSDWHLIYKSVFWVYLQVGLRYTHLLAQRWWDLFSTTPFAPLVPVGNQHKVSSTWTLQECADADEFPTWSSNMRSSGEDLTVNTITAESRC